MDIKLANNKEQWDSWLIANCKYSRFPQSWEWGEILRSEGKRVERLQVVDSETVIAQAQVTYHRMPLRGPWYAFCPRGPVLVMNQELGIRNQGAAMYDCLYDYLKKQNCVFFRTESSTLIHNSKFLILKSLDINPRATVMLDLGKTDEVLLKNMHPKTRYNIRVAQKRQLGVRNNKNFNVFWDLIQKTGTRDGFRLHNETHYRAIFESPLSSQLTVYQGDQPLAAALFIGFGNKFTYLFGASDHRYRQLMAPHLIQWEGIQLGKRLGYTCYDFFGVAPNTAQYGGGYDYHANHQYAGVTRFKLGFGGKVVEDPGTYDLIISSPRYRIYQFLRTVRRFI